MKKILFLATLLALIPGCTASLATAALPTKLEQIGGAPGMIATQLMLQEIEQVNQIKAAVSK